MQMTAYDMRISGWSSDVCSSDLGSITMLSFAFRIVTIPLTLYALSVLSVLFPRFVSSWNDGDLSGHAAVIRKGLQIGRASCRERVCQYVWISEVAVT